MYLLLSICASTLIFVIFKVVGKRNINTLQTIVINYFTAFTYGILSYDAPIIVSDIIQSKWFFGAIGLGFLFIAIFNVMALTAQRNGLSVASVASKMSVVIPIIFGLFFYNESLGWQKALGIVLALLAVYLASYKAKTDQRFSIKTLWLPIILFLGSGTIDTSIKYIETTFLADNGIPIFSATIFFIAGVIGIGLLSAKAIQKQFTFDPKSIVSGVILGVVNYYSIYTLLKALNAENFESSTIFTVNNVAIVMLTTLIGLLLFKERLLTKNWIGIGIAVLSIILVTLS
ncbi:MAG: drug/metabolite transporter (DMT)-like permease [Olleya marilimosa]|jgi:drug/metabolite transporter (DMT)-like permease|uniref:DMT family transporter n=1 Tax=Olleya marilimosa TaxID=272164 RepID=UPI0004828128|nr:DMT family transporter [Olleya marilimosa]|tara:strand:+ start:366830 stop:367693 length:864 start_codon:yes stop_codon:yes gene_type:complete